MVEFAGSVDESLRVISSDEITLELSIALIDSLQFYYLIYDRFNNKIGNCGIRLSDKEKNGYYGNIEYEIFPQYRGNNYAEKATKLLYDIALYYKVSKITITADPSNFASIKTIENLGARFICVKKVPRRLKLYKTSKQVRIYELNLEGEKRNDRY